jgi:hypothetical protein
MHKLVPLLVLIATASTFCHASGATELRFASPIDRLSAAGVSGDCGAVLLVGGMGGTGTGGMTGGGVTGGGMPGGGMTGGGMTGGGMTGGGMGNITGMPRPSTDGTTGYGYVPGGSDPAGAGAAPYTRSETTGDGPQRPQYYHCVTKRGRCSVSSELGARRTGASCSCMFGGKGKIR